ncbi:dihydrofolate reductase [Williamsia limnetica]|uniref:Dihydrofolate reductase n=1 Tax=Williamsia limnetica TaxID=882452 RepID=A0A318RQG1_WILLI|nr:dihydrofolate reductase family protein [Williamsia limnetica]PYE20173.1 dihydrofolate reductase [Williamsia limnetica]
MGILTYSMHISLDGFIEEPNGSIDFSAPDDEIHRIANQQAQDTAVFLFGRGLYEMMEEFWTDPERADGGDTEAQFARVYTETPRVVFSDTLDSVPDGCRLVRSADSHAEVERLKADTDGTLSVGGAQLAASLVDLIDVIDPFVVPTMLGGGKPFYPPGHQLSLTLDEHRILPVSGWMYLRYSVSR